MKFNEVIFNKRGTEIILSSLGEVLREKGKDVSFAFDYDFICGIKVGDYYICEPKIKAFGLLYRVEKNGSLIGWLDHNALLDRFSGVAK